MNDVIVNEVPTGVEGSTPTNLTTGTVDTENQRKQLIVQRAMILEQLNTLKNFLTDEYLKEEKFLPKQTQLKNPDGTPFVFYVSPIEAQEELTKALEQNTTILSALSNKLIIP